MSSSSSSSSSSSLSPASGEQQQKVETFCNVTGADATTAEALLDACQGNLQMAIDLHLEGGAGPAPSASSASSAGPSASSSGAGPSVAASSGAGANPDDDDDVRAPIPQRTATLVEPGYEGYALPAAANGGAGGRLNPHRGRVKTVFDGFRNFGAESKNYGSGQGPSKGSSSSSSTSSSSSSLPVSRGKRQTLEELFKPPLDLMHKGDFQSAKDSAERRQKWLLINIQDAGEFLCQTLNRDVWSCKAVKELVGERFVFWQQYKESEDAQRYMTFYPVTEWPHVAVLDPRTGEKLITWNKIPSASCFQDLVAEFLSLHPSFAATKEMPPSRKRKAEESTNIVDADEDAQLLAAIQASLQSEEAKKKRDDDADDDDDNWELEWEDDSNLSAPPSTTATPSKDGKSSTKRDETEAAKKDNATTSSTSSSTSFSSSLNGNRKKEADKAGAKEEEMDKEKREKTEDWTKFLGPETDEKSTIMIRYPDGKREESKFPCSSPLKAVILFVVSQGFPLDRYEIVTNFPRRTLTDLEQDKTLKELGLFPREAVFVQQKA